MTVVQNIVKDAAGNPLPNTQCLIRLVGAPAFDSTTSSETVTVGTVTTDVNGQWSKDLTPVSHYSPAGCYYTVSEPGGSLHAFTVPDTGGPYWLNAVLTVAPTAPEASLLVLRGDVEQAWTLDEQAQGQMNLGITGGGGGGAVDSVNGQTGAVVLGAADVGADAAGAAATAQAAAIAASQPLDSDLTAIAALTTTVFGRSLLTAADAAALRTAAVLGTAATANTGDFDASGAAAAAQSAAISAAATDATTKANAAQAAAIAASQPLDSDLTAIAALTTTSFGRSFLALADAAAARALLALGGAATLNVGTTSTTVAAGDAPAIAAAAATLAEAFGTTQGVPVSPWAPSPTLGSELWALANFQTGGGYNSTTLTPSLTANGTNQTSKTRVSIGNMGNGDTTYRIEFDFNITAASNASISLLLTDSSSALISGTTQQRMVTATCKLKTGHYVFDFRPPAAGGTYVELRLDTGSAVSSGVVGVSNVSLKQTGEVSRPMMVAQYASGQVFPVVYWQHKDATTRAWRAARLSFKDDNNLTPVAYNSIDSWSSDVFLTGLNVPADPAFTRVDQTIGASVDSVNGLELSGSASMRSNNNDQIMEVWNGSAFELRCNTHGGEYPRAGTSPSYKIDQGSGFVPWTLAEGLVPIRRFQISIPSEVRRSTDGTTPFANVDHTFTVFPDGVVRCDRTTTFLSTQLFRSYFEWMSSHSLTTPYLGRIGRGLTVQANVDTHPKVATPAAPTVTTSTSGGTLAAGTYSYRIAALSPYGETLASTAGTVTTTGSTSTATPAWSTVASATGYRVYGRTAGVEKLLATLGAAATSWTDDGSLPPIGDQQAFSTARLYTGVLATALVVDNAESTDASWAVWLNPLTRYCQGAIYDRESALARAGVAKIRTRIEGTPNTIQKNYANLYWTSGDTFSIPAGTVWTATHWSMSYIPENTDRFHTELAYRAANLSSLAALYPNT